MSPHLNLHLLRIFHAVVEAGSLSRAALQLHISQSAVSKGLAELEAQIGMQLLIRRAGAGGGIALTEAGRELLVHARVIFGHEQLALQAITERRSGARGRLRVGASTTVAAHALPTVLAAFIRAHPSIDVSLQVANTEDIAAQLAETRLDVGFVEGEVQRADLRATPWRTDPLRLVGPPQAKAPTAADCWLLREPGSGTRQAADRLLAERGILPQRIVEVASNDAIAALVTLGAGYAVLPEVIAAPMLHEGRMCGFDRSPLSQRELYRLEPAGIAPSPALQQLIALLVGP